MSFQNWSPDGHLWVYITCHGVLYLTGGPLRGGLAWEVKTVGGKVNRCG